MKPTNKFQNFLIRSLGIPQYLEEQNKRNLATSSIMFQDDFASHRQLEYYEWYKGEPERLEYFYKNKPRFEMYESNSFWHAVNTNMPKLHYPLPQTISNAFGTLLFSNEPSFIVDSGSTARDKKYNKRLEELLDVNDFMSLLQSSAQLASYSGAVGFKLNIDPTLSDLPLITVYPKEYLHEEKKYGQTIYIEFIDDLGDEYKLITRYGMGYINYTLFYKGQKVELTAHSYTASLKDIAFFDTKGTILPIIFAVVVPNKSGDRSDYEGLIPSFQALDEIYSSMVNYIRKTKPNTFITEDLVKKDQYNRVIPFSEFDNIITILDQAPKDANGRAETKVDRDVIQLNIDGYKNALETLREEVLIKTSLSPGTLGLKMPGAGSRESAEALAIRERASVRARNEKLSIYKERLDTLLTAALVLDDLMRTAVPNGDGIYIIDKIDDFEVKVDFGAYAELNQTEKLNMYRDALNNKLCSVEFAITKTFGDELSDVELQRLIIDTKLENGIALNEKETVWLSEQKK